MSAPLSLGLLAALLAAGWFAAIGASRLRSVRRQTWSAEHSSSGSMASFGLLCVHLFVNTVVLEHRSDARALFTQGLSTQNQIQVGITLLAALWAFVLVTSGRLRPRDLVSGPRLIVTLLVVWYLPSFLWSATPDLSTYRAVELAAVWCLAVHAFSGRRSAGLGITYATMAVAAAWVSTTFVPSGTPSSSFVGSYSSNGGSPIAGLLLLIALLAPGAIRTRAGRLWLAIAAAVSLLAFMSVTVVAGLAGAALTYVLLRAGGSRARLTTSVLACALIVVLVAPPLSMADRALGAASAALRNDQFHAVTWSGRLPLWRELVRDAQREPIGRGIAADRSLVLQDVERTTGWKPLHAHNGFLAALVAGGWPALVLTVFVLLAMLRLVSAAPAHLRPVAAAGVVLLAVNNLTVSGIGGSASPLWVLAMAVVAGGWRTFDRSAEARRGAHAGQHDPTPAVAGGRSAHAVVMALPPPRLSPEGA